MRGEVVRGEEVYEWREDVGGREGGGVGGRRCGREEVWEGGGVGGRRCGREEVWEGGGVGGRRCGREEVWEGGGVGGRRCGRERCGREEVCERREECVKGGRRWVRGERCVREGAFS